MSPSLDSFTRQDSSYREEKPTEEFSISRWILSTQPFTRAFTGCQATQGSHDEYERTTPEPSAPPKGQRLCYALLCRTSLNSQWSPRKQVPILGIRWGSRGTQAQTGWLCSPWPLAFPQGKMKVFYKSFQRHSKELLGKKKKRMLFVREFNKEKFQLISH